jgi:RNA polymerase primary sigma factor
MKIEKKITAQDSENLSRYFADIRKFDTLTKEQEKECIILIQGKSDPKAMERLVNANLKFVVSVAKHFQGQGIPLLDLISEGNAGLIEAAHRFDVSKDLKFFSYAVWWIRIKIFTNMDYNSRVIQLPANRTLLVSKVKKIILEMEQTLGRFPTLDELADHSDIECSMKELQEAIAYGGKARSIHETISMEGDDAGETTLEYVLEGDMGIDQINRTESILKDLDRFLYHLTQNEYDVMVLSLGLNGERIVRNSDIAKSLKLKEKEIMKIKARAIKRLKKLKNINSLQDYIQ